MKTFFIVSRRFHACVGWTDCPVCLRKNSRRRNKILRVRYLCGAVRGSESEVDEDTCVVGCDAMKTGKL